MTVYTGILQNLSGGSTISSQGRVTSSAFSGRVYEAGRDPHAGMVKREFVDIGDQRIKNVILFPYHDAALQESLGQEVTLSVAGPRAGSMGRKRVLAIRTSRGVDRPGLPRVVIAAVVNLVQVLLFTLIVGGILGGIAWGIFGKTGLVVALIAALAFITWRVIFIARSVKAWAAL